MKAADRSGAAVAILVGADELAAGTVTARDMRGTGGQHAVARAEVIPAVLRFLNQPAETGTPAGAPEPRES